VVRCCTIVSAHCSSLGRPLRRTCSNPTSSTNRQCLVTVLPIGALSPLPAFLPFFPPSFPSPPSLSAGQTLKLQVLLRCSSARVRCRSTRCTNPSSNVRKPQLPFTHYPPTATRPPLICPTTLPLSPSSARHSTLFPPAIELLFSIQKVHCANLVARLITFPSPKILPPSCIQDEPLHHPEGNYSAAPCIFLDPGHLRRYAAQALAIRLIPRRPTFFNSPHYCRLNKRHQSCRVVHARK